MKLSVCVILMLATFAGVDADGGISAIVSAAASAVSAGTSLAGTTMSGLMNTGYRVNCGIEVENWTRFPLTYPEVTLDGGALATPPHSVLPSKREGMVARKSGYTATGSYGTVSWLVEGLQRRVVVMWSAPFNFDHYSNWLGVGITKKGSVTHHKDWFNQMYYGVGDSYLGFGRKEYRSKISPVLYRDNDIEINGIMGSSHQAKVKITVRPLNLADAATPIKHLLKTNK